MAGFVRAEEGDTSLLDEPPPLNYPFDYVLQTWTAHRLHKIYPQAGGFDDQDALLMDDWHTLTLYYLRVKAGVRTTITAEIEAPVINTLFEGE